MSRVGSSMRLGIFSWYGYMRPLLERLGRIAAAGFDSTMLWWAEESAIPEDVVRRSEDLGLTVENVHVPFENANGLWSEDPHERLAFLEEYRGYILGCAKLCVPGIVMHISRGNVARLNEYGVECMAALAREASRCGVWLAIENTRRVDLVQAILDGIPSDTLGLCYDTSHGRLYEDDEFGLLRRYRDRLTCVHISDNDGQADRHWAVGEGVVDWEGFIRNFPQDSYQGVLSLEVYPRDESEPETKHLRKAFESIVQLRSRIEATDA